MNVRPLLVFVLLASGCAGSLDVFPEKYGEDTGTTDDFDPGSTTDTGMSGGSSNGGSGSGASGDGSSGSGAGDSSTGSGSGDSSSGSGSGDSSSGSGSGDDSSGSGSGDDSSGSGTTGGSTGGSGSSGSGSTGGSSSGSGSSGSGSTGGSSGSGSTGGGTASYGTGRYSQKVGFEVYPGSYPCQYEWDVTMTAASTYCSGCDFVMNGTFTYNSAASYTGASYCSAGTVFSAVLAHDSDYWGSVPTALYYDPTYFAWYPLDYSASYSGGNWSWGAGTYDYYYLDWYTFYAYYYTNYGRMNATIY